MGLITHPEKPGQYYNVRKGYLTYKDREGNEQRAFGYVGFFHGIRTRVDAKYKHTTIDLYFHDPRDRLLVVCSGILFTEETGWTTYGKMILQHLAHPSVAAMRGKEMKLSVWGREGKHGQIVNFGRLLEPKSDQSLPHISTSDMSRDEIAALCPAWLTMALDRFAIPNKGNAIPADSDKSEEAPVSDGLPF